MIWETAASIFSRKEIVFCRFSYYLKKDAKPRNKGTHVSFNNCHFSEELLSISKLNQTEPVKCWYKGLGGFNPFELDSIMSSLFIPLHVIQKVSPERRCLGWPDCFKRYSWHFILPDRQQWRDNHNLWNNCTWLYMQTASEFSLYLKKLKNAYKKDKNMKRRNEHIKM